MSSTWVASRPATEPTCQNRKLSRAPRSVTTTAPMRLWARAMTADPAASNYEVVAISLGLWTPARPALTQDLIERFPEAIVGMQAWMGDDALGRLVLTAYPCLVGERTAAMTEQMLSRTDLTPGVRRALIDIGHRHEEAMRSLQRYAATPR